MSARPRILLASPDTRAVLAQSRAVLLLGWENVSAGDAANALAQSRRVQAAVIDTRLPGEGGLATLRRLRASAATAALPVIMAGPCDSAEASLLLAEGACEVQPDVLAADAIVQSLRHHLAHPRVVLQAPAAVLGDPARLAALARSGLMDAPAGAAFDGITALVGRLLGAPTALLSLVDTQRQFFRSSRGLGEPWASARQTPLTHSFCQWVAAASEAVCVADAREHPLLRDNLAIRDLGVVAYAGVPVRASGGETLGSLCAIDSRPRDWTPEDEATLQDLARLAEAAMAGDVLRSPGLPAAADLAASVAASAVAIEAGIGLLRRRGDALPAADRDALLDLLAGHARQLGLLCADGLPVAGA